MLTPAQLTDPSSTARTAISPPCIIYASAPPMQLALAMPNSICLSSCSMLSAPSWPNTTPQMANLLSLPPRKRSAPRLNLRLTCLRNSSSYRNRRRTHRPTSPVFNKSSAAGISLSLPCVLPAWRPAMSCRSSSCCGRPTGRNSPRAIERCSMQPPGSGRADA